MEQIEKSYKVVYGITFARDLHKQSRRRCHGALATKFAPDVCRPTHGSAAPSKDGISDSEHSGFFYLNAH